MRSLEIHAMISSWYTDGEMNSMVRFENLNFALKMTVDGISQWNHVLVSLFKLPQKNTRFFIVYLFSFSEWVLRFFNCKNLSPKLASQLWPVKYTSDLKNTQTGSCLGLSWQSNPFAIVKQIYRKDSIQQTEWKHYQASFFQSGRLGTCFRDWKIGKTFFQKWEKV